MEVFNNGEEEWRGNDEEEVLSGEDVEQSYSEQVRHQIESNKPALIELEITGRAEEEVNGDESTAQDGNWERDGKSIGRNTNLREVTLGLLGI